MSRSFVLLALVASIAGVARADEATEAKLRFDHGLALYDRGKIREALDEFFVSNRLAPNPSASFNIATCLEALDRFDEAYSAYSDYLASELSKDERAQGDAALAKILPKVARLRVSTSPSGAALYLDRKNLGQYGLTPRALAALPGKHVVLLTLAGHREETREVVLVRGEEIAVEATLAPLEGRVRVASQPAGASIVSEDGASLGVTPAELSLPIGTRRLTIAHAGFASEHVEAHVTESLPANVEVALAPLPPPKGRMRVLANVASALVTIDGVEAGFSPLLLEVEAGAHQVAVHLPGYRPFGQAVDISADKTAAMEVTLEPEQQAIGRGPWPWVLLTTSAASGAVGLGIGARALGVAGEYERNPTRELYERGKTLNVAADVMLGIALLGGAATGALFLFGEDVDERDSSAMLEVR